MKLGTLFVITAVIALLFSLGFVLIPTTLLSLYAVDLNAQGIFISRLLGAAFVIFAIISWQLRNSTGSSEARSVVLAFTVGDLLGFVISLIYQLQGLANALGWSTVAIYLLLGLGFGYFYIKK